MNGHRGARSIWPPRVLPLQLAQGDSAGRLSFLPRLIKHWLLETAFEGPMIDPEH